MPKPTRDGNHWRTMAGIDGCMMATPKPMSVVAAKRVAVPGLTPRSAAPSATISSPPTSVRVVPRRAMNSEPGRAARENNATGRLMSSPTAVAERCRSARMSGRSGGTARMVSRKPVPQSQSKPTAIAVFFVICTFICVREPRQADWPRRRAVTCPEICILV